MNTLRVNLPSEKKMKALCHDGDDKLLPLQAFSLLVPLTTGFFGLCCAAAAVGSCSSYLAGNGFGSSAGMLEWVQSTLVFAVAAAGTVVALAVFAKIYMRSQFGSPTHTCDMQVDLNKEDVLDVCHAYLRSHCLFDCLLEDTQRDRLVALVDEGRHSMTFLDITAISHDHESTWIVIRTASVVTGKAALLSAFFNDFGTARDAANDMANIFTAYASRKRRRGPRSSQQALPRLKPIGAAPPPMSKRTNSGWRVAARVIDRRRAAAAAGRD